MYVLLIIFYLRSLHPADVLVDEIRERSVLAHQEERLEQVSLLKSGRTHFTQNSMVSVYRMILKESSLPEAGFWITVACLPK